MNSVTFSFDITITSNGNNKCNNSISMKGSPYIIAAGVDLSYAESSNTTSFSYNKSTIATNAIGHFIITGYNIRLLY
jgi:hypothetical protein